MTEKRYEEAIVDGIFLSANTCRRCDRPFAPYGVGVPSEHVDSYCWGDAQHRLSDLEHALADAIECVCDWAAYADDYFKEKWDLKGDIARLQAVLDGGEWIDE